jgi:hypothetical protein
MHAQVFDPGETFTSSSPFKVSILTSAVNEGVVFPVFAISGLYPFILSVFGLHARPPTHKVESCLSSSKGWLPGGWLSLPGRASHPLVCTTLLGRIRLSALCQCMSAFNNPGTVKLFKSPGRAESLPM